MTMEHLETYKGKKINPRRSHAILYLTIKLKNNKNTIFSLQTQ
jgi:hypothetical protein